MTDEPQKQTDQPDNPELPESFEGDPKSETVIRRSEALKRMISAFQPTATSENNIVDAALDVDRSVEPAPASADEKTLFRPPTTDSTIMSATNVKRQTDELRAAVESSARSMETPPLGIAHDAARRLERRLEEAAKSDEAKAEEAAKSAADSWTLEPEKPVEAAKSVPDSWTLEPEKPVEAAKPAADSWTLEPEKPATDSWTLEPEKPVEAAKSAVDSWTLEPEKPAEAAKPAALKPDESKPSGIVPTIRPEPKVIDAHSITARSDNALTGSPDEAPWTLQQFFNGEIDLDVELAKRFPTMPMLSIIKFRTLGTNSSRRVATLSTQDGAASLIVDADVATKVIQLSFTLGSMLTLRFGMADLSDMDRNRWVELMRRDQGGLAFLWGPTRWADDYMICIARKYFTNLYAFSPHNFEAGVRLTPGVTKQLLDWLEELWKAQFKQDDDAPPLLTW